MTKVIKGNSFKGQNEHALKETSAVLLNATGKFFAIFCDEWSNSVKEEGTYIFTNLRVKEEY